MNKKQISKLFGVGVIGFALVVGTLSTALFIKSQDEYTEALTVLDVTNDTETVSILDVVDGLDEEGLNRENENLNKLKEEDSERAKGERQEKDIDNQGKEEKIQKEKEIIRSKIKDLIKNKKGIMQCDDYYVGIYERDEYDKFIYEELFIKQGKNPGLIIEVMYEEGLTPPPSVY